MLHQRTELGASDLTNQQVAAKLAISTRTVDTHVTNILRKLGLSSRTEMREWAAAQNVDFTDTSSAI